MKLAWQYDCRCGIVAYSFDGTPTIRDSMGHDVRRGSRAIYYGGKFSNSCQVCGLSANSHSGVREDEWLYGVVCPVAMDKVA